MTDYFSTKKVRSELEGRSIRGGAITVIAQGARLGLQLLTVVLLARILVPADFGLFAMAVAVSGIIGLLSTVGLSLYTIHKENLTPQESSNVFWMGLVLSLIAMTISVAVAPIASVFFGEPVITPLIIALSTSFVAQSLYSQHQALLTRQMMFKHIAIINLSGLVLGVLVSCAAGLLGWKYWALVLLQIVPLFYNVLLMWIVVKWRPNRFRKQKDFRMSINFGKNLTGFTIVNYFGRNADNVLLGWQYGSSDLGPYAIAYKLLLAPIQLLSVPINQMAVPVLSRLTKEPDEYRVYYTNILSATCLFSFPIAILSFLMSKEIIFVFLGDQWAEASEIFSYLALVAFMHPVYTSMGILYISSGRADRLFYWACISNPITVLGFVVGLKWGATGVAMSYAVTNALLFVPGLFFALKTVPVSFADVFKATSKPLLIGLCVAATVSILGYMVVPGSSDGVRLLVTTFGAGFSMLLAVPLVFKVETVKQVLSHVLGTGRQD